MLGVRVGERVEPVRLDRLLRVLVERRRRQRRGRCRARGCSSCPDRSVAPAQEMSQAGRLVAASSKRKALPSPGTSRLPSPSASLHGALPVARAVVARRVDPEHAGRRRLVDLLREPAGAVEAAEQERVRVHDDVRLEHVRDVVDGLAELVGRVVVDEPVGRAGRHVVDDLAHELAVARAVGVEVAAGEPVGRVERQPVLALERRQLACRPARSAGWPRRRPGRARRS